MAQVCSTPYRVLADTACGSEYAGRLPAIFLRSQLSSQQADFVQVGRKVCCETPRTVEVEVWELIYPQRLDVRAERVITAIYLHTNSRFKTMKQANTTYTRAL